VSEFVETTYVCKGAGTNCDENAEELLSASKEGTVLLQRLIHFDNARAGKQLHHQARSNDWRYSQLHQGAPIVNDHVK
jgi:hypothetical protein